MSGRNPMGARLPPREQQGPRLLPDGSESQHHGGSFHAYMAHKINKLDEQFLDHASGTKQTQLFKGVAIHVNGFTVPTHHELRQLMAVHGGSFQNYFARDVVTHIVCSNLPDAKVKEYEKARQPPAIIRPEWVVDSIRAGRLLPTQDYALQQLRDAPGQRKLKAFQKVQLQALPPSAIYGGQAAAVVGSAAANEQSVGQSAAAAAGLEGATAASGSHPEALGGTAPRPASVDTAQRTEGEARAEAGPTAAAVPSSTPAAAAAAAPDPAPPPPLPPAAAPAQAPPISPGPGPPAARPRSPGAGPALATAAAVGGYDLQELRQALALAAKLRSECDGLKGPPKSSRDDPDFVRNFHKYSRLHFIGSWRARIEALMASAAGSQGPAPQRPSAAHPRTVVHLDMDCFFASVSEVAHPVLRGKPVAVSHSASASGTGEVSTCNYEARKYGVRSGMWISQAKELCPALVVVPYMFAEYEAVSEKVYRTLLRRTSCVEALSCDEAYLDVTGLGDPEQLAAEIRAEIQSTTGCTASAGIGPNPLMARIASERAKPNGQLRIHGGPQALEFLQGLAADALPGVGWATREQLKGHGITTVADLQASGSSKAFLQGLLGQKQGAMLWDFAHGRDNRSVEPFKTRKSVGAEVNYGLRFSTQDDAWKVLDDLAGEVQERLRRAGVKGRTVTLKLKRKKPGAVEPAKFLGHGECDSFSKSTSLVRFTDVAADIARESRALLLSFQVPPAEIRGLGIQVTKLDNDGSAARPGSAASSKLAAFLQLGQQQAAERQGEQQQAEEQQQQQQQIEPEQRTEVERQPVADTALQPQELTCPADEAVPQPQQQPPTALPPLQPPEQQHQQPLEQHGEDRTGSSQGMGAAGVLATSAPSKLSPAKQVSLEASLARAAAASQERPGERLGTEQRQHLLQQWQGVSLSQMDAAALESLPYEVQRELVGAAGGQLQQNPPWQRDSEPLHEQAGAQQQHGEEMAGAGSAAEREAKARGKRPLLGPEAASDEEGPAWGADASALPAPWATGVAPQQQPAGAVRSGAAAGSSRAAAQPASPIVALPAFSQVDPAVLEALPLSMRRELEVAYGIGKHAPGPLAPAQRAGRGGGGMPRHVSKRQRLDAFVANPPPYGVSARGQAVAARHVQQRRQQEAVQLSLSQLDPTVLQELPTEVRQELLQQLQQQQQPAGDDGHRQQQRRSRLGQQRDKEQAWQWRWREEQALREAEEAAAVDGVLLASRAGWEAAGQPLGENAQQEAGQEDGAPPVPVAVELFLQQAEQAGSAQSLAAALADCLRQLEEQLVTGGAASSPAQHLQSQLLPEKCAGHGSGNAGGCPNDGRHRSSLADTPRGSKDSGAGSASRDPGVPSTQPVGQAGADQHPGSSKQQAPALSPRQDSMQRNNGRQQGGAPDAAFFPAASPGAARPDCPGGSGNSGTASCSQLQPALKELGRCLQQAAAELLAARDLEQLRTLLRAVLKLGEQHPWFEAGAGQAAMAAAQRAVQARYGWPLRLPGLLDASDAGNRV
ncbi:hypothetical protein ABPG77_008523 [Micractinium sp. CCAP 211/92]